MGWFYEIRSSINLVLKRDGGFPTQDAANCRTRRPKKMKNVGQPDRPDVGRILVGRNVREATGSAIY
jgi:hypothetical protein